ncbi:GNAT family N-acetyltransferase [Kineococcus sp. GCM10028916]|uniref:GNAT family N-acetyltransferase n=1 Tax=Kineococcus sp. GCM10028916 TaxID=3273394 RepID=UPI00363FB6FB
MDSALVDVVRRHWEHLAGPGARFAPVEEARALVAPGSVVFPAGWCGIVTIAGRVLATAPDADGARVLDDHLRGGRPSPPAVLGPARLAYLARDVPLPTVPGELHPTDPGDALQNLLRGCSADDVGESGMTGIDSPAFLVVEDGETLAAAGYELWPNDVAHLCVLVRAGARGRHLARTVAARASAHAQSAGLLCQWRARPADSLRVARSLGYEVLGNQLGLRW